MHKRFFRHTIRCEVTFEGVGLHSGEMSRMRFIPDDTSGTLIFIFRGVKIPAKLDYARSTGRFTFLEKENAKVLTIEHFLSACFALKITDGVVEVYGKTGELPVLDGSAIEFLKCLNGAGREELSETEPVKITCKFEKEWQSGRKYRVREHEGMAVRCLIHYPHHPSIGRQSIFLELSIDEFSSHIAPARTFALEEEIERIRELGLGKGGNEKNTVIYTRTSTLNPQSQTFKDEAVRHKLLDFLGDLYLFSPHVQALFDIHKPGHRYNLKFFNLLTSAGVYKLRG